MGEHGVTARVAAIIENAIVSLNGLRVGSRYVAAVEWLDACATRGGCVVTTGIGKSALVAQRLAATFTVTGMDSYFLHPVDALHGDIGRLRHKDVLLMVSRSGESDELLDLVAAGVTTDCLLITAEPLSTLAKIADVVLVHSGMEACPYNLVPTTSLTVASVIGDALALVLRERRGIGAKEFKALHKNGSLGRRLTLAVKDVMVTGDDIGYLTKTDNLITALDWLARKRGTAAVVGGSVVAPVLEGVVTAGDITRVVAGTANLKGVVADVMTPEPYKCTPEEMVADVIEGMQVVGIMAMPVVDKGNHVVGMIHLHDALRARVG